jgi:stage V sporulation protein B
MKRPTIKRRIIRAGTITVLGSGASIVLGVVVRSLIARVWGPEGMGEYAGFMMFVSLFGVIAAFSLPRAVLKFTAEYEESGSPDKIRRLFSTVFLFLTLTCVLTAAASLFFSPRLGKLIHLPVDRQRALLLGVTLLLGMYSMLASTLFLGLLQNLRGFAISISSLLAMLALAVYAYLAKPFPVYLLLVAGYLVAGLLGVFLARHQGLLVFRFDRGELKRALAFALPLAAVSGLEFFVEWFDRFSLGVYFGPREMGLFSAGLVVFSAARRLPLSLTEVLVPSYSKISLSGKEVLGRAISKNIALYGVAFCFLALAIFLYRTEIIVLLFSGDFAEAATILGILSWTFIFSSITNPGSSLLIGCGHTKLNSLNYAVGVGVLIPSLIVFTRFWGTTGAAAAKLLTHAVTTVGMLIILKRALRLQIDFLPLAKILVFASAVGGLMILLRRLTPSLLVGVPVLCVLYFGGVWLLVLGREEKAYLREILRQARQGRKMFHEPGVEWERTER